MKRCVVVAIVLLVGCGRSRFAAQDASPDTTAIDEDAPFASCGHTACDDFNDGDLSSWTTETGGGGTGVVVNGQFVVTVNATLDSYFLVMALPAPTTSVTVTMKLGYATTNAGTNCELDLASLHWDSGTCTTPFGFNYVRDGTNPFNLQETNGNSTCTNNRNNYYSVLDNTGLHDVKLTVMLGAANVATAQVDLDGTPLPVITMVQPVPSAPLTLKVGGIGDRNVTGIWTITYDDVIVDVQ